MPNVMEERLEAARARNAEAEQPAPTSRRPAPMLNPPKPSGNLIGAMLVCAVFLAIFVASFFGGPAPTAEKSDSRIFPTTAPAAASPAPTTAPSPIGESLYHSTNRTPAPVPTGYIIGTMPQTAPAAPVAAPAPPVVSELVPLPTEAPAVRSCADVGRGPCRGSRP